MQLIVWFFLIWLGSTLTNGLRDPANCGNNDKLRITPLQGTTGEQWATGYTGAMFKVVAIHTKLYNVVWKVKYNEKEETFKYTWSGSQYKEADENTQNGVFELRGYKYKNNKFEITLHKINSTVKIKQISFDINTDGKAGKCSVKNIAFKECQTKHPLLVNSTSTYLSKGHFYCDKGFNIFPINQNTRTTCSIDGEWENKDKFMCYGAPNDTQIVGNLMIKENEKMEIYCKFTQTTPTAEQSKLSFGNESLILNLNESYTRKVTIEDDGKEIWCQPISSYTETPQFSEKGKSPIRQLRVLFAPKSINHDSNLTCDWIIGNDGNSCDFTFLSRPSADNISLFLDQSNTEVDFTFSNTSTGDNQTVKIEVIQESQLSSQRFRLQVVSTLFSDSLLTIPFDLNVKRIVKEEINKQTKLDHTTIIIILVMGGFLVFICFISLAVVVKRRNLKNENNSPTGGTVREERFNEIYEAGDVDFVDTSVREERINVIYEAGDDGAEGISVREERCNIIYGTGDVGAEENTYHEVNNSDQLYSTVDVGKTDFAAGISTKRQSFNNSDQQLYSTVDVSKKTKANLPGSSTQSSQVFNDSEQLYSSVDVSKKTRNNLNGETSTQDSQSSNNSNDLYSTVDVSKKT